MTTRGSYAKGIAKRDEILTTALEVIAEHGFRKTTLRELAAAVELSQAGLLHYFGTKEELFVAVLRKRDELDSLTIGADGSSVLDLATAGSRDPLATTELTGEAVLAAIVRVTEHNTKVPGLVRLFTQLQADALDETHPAHEYFRERSLRCLEFLGGAIRELQVRGALAESIDADQAALLLLAASDGLQTHWLLDPRVNMAQSLQALWDAAIKNA